MCEQWLLKPAGVSGCWGVPVAGPLGRYSVGHGGLCLTPAEVIAAEQPLSTLRDWVYGEKFQPAAGVLSPNCFLMGGS